MGITEILGLLGGLALFLYGMQMMSEGLEDAAGNKMKSILEKLTSNRFLGVAVGAGITAVIQSSSATTVMVVGFVNSGMMTLKQAVWIIMGANIGTTITGQLIALDVGMLAPLFAFIGVATVVFIKAAKVQHIGKIFAGLGVLFIGMNMMGDSMVPLRESEAFVEIMTKFSNPFLGILAGAVFTAVIQSSSASVGILQTLATAGLIGFPNAVFVLFGQNIGTCITAVLASIGTNRSAKRTTIIHLMFNIIGTIVFTTLCLLLPVTDWVGGITPDDPSKQIANMHTIFNIVTTSLLIPFGTYLAKFAEKILPDTGEETDGVTPLSKLNAEFRRGRMHLGSTAVHTDLLSQEIHRMVALSGENTYRAYNVILNGSTSVFDEVVKHEETIDALNKEVSQYISKILVDNNCGDNVADVEQYFLITGNAERIGDHALNIAGYIDVIRNKKIAFSDEARAELSEMQTITKEALDKVLNMKTATPEWLSDIAAFEQRIDDMTETYREQHLERMRQGKCTEEACILYSELLTDFERIGDHILNIAQAYSKIEITA
ncbi:MAG: Na/Pi cotransporter family protein [Oscillospiraceae bacterium]|nr:Na/Pi cotransporter family protein [Oscillospiraceae bacterium]